MYSWLESKIIYCLQQYTTVFIRTKFSSHHTSTRNEGNRNIVTGKNIC